MGTRGAPFCCLGVSSSKLLFAANLPNPLLLSLSLCGSIEVEGLEVCGRVRLFAV